MFRVKDKYWNQKREEGTMTTTMIITIDHRGKGHAEQSEQIKTKTELLNTKDNLKMLFPYP